jgi:hypothetical protein
MTEYVSMNRDDAYWLLARVGELSGTKNVDRLTRIARGLDFQPRREGRPAGDPSGFDVFVVQVEYTEGPPIAVRTTPDAAFEIARVFNLAGGATAAVRGYRFDGVGNSTALEIPGS